MNEQGDTYRTKFPEPNWHEIAERAAVEKDPQKLARLVKALCDRLDEMKRSASSDGR